MGTDLASTGCRSPCCQRGGVAAYWGTSPAVVPAENPSSSETGHADGAGETPALSSASPGAWEACPKCHHKTCRWELVGRKHDPTKEVPWFRCHKFAKCDYKVFGTSA